MESEREMTREKGKMEGVQKKMKKTFSFISALSTNPSTISPVRREPFCGSPHYSNSYSALLQGDEAVRRSPLGNALTGPPSQLQYELEARGERAEKGGWVGGWGQVGWRMRRIRQKDPGVGGQSSSSSPKTIESSSESHRADGNLGSWASAVC